MTGIDICVKAAGGQRPVAELCDVTAQAVSLWVAQGWVPSARARLLADTYGVPVVDLVRPDLRELFSA